MKLNINGNIIEVEDSVITKAIEDKQESIEINNDLVIRTAADETKFAANTRTEGISIGAEIGRKEVLKGFGIEGDGQHKSDASAISALKGFSDGLVAQALKDAKIAPDKKVEELNNDIKTLQGTISGLNTTNENQAKEFKTFKNNQLISSSLTNEVPENALLDKKTMLTIMQSSIKLGVNENGVVFGVGPDGQPLKDSTTLEPLSVKTIAANFFNERNDLLKPSTGGAGGGDSGGGSGKQSFDDFIKEMGDAGHTPNGPQFNVIMGERMRAGTLDV